jgi:hypothetical protein
MSSSVPISAHRNGTHLPLIEMIHGKCESVTLSTCDEQLQVWIRVGYRRARRCIG